MKKLNLFWLRIVELLITIILAMFVLFGNLDTEIGLVLDNKIKWIPFLLLCTLLFLVLIEFAKEKPFFRVTYLLIAVISCSLMFTEGISEVNASCWLMGLIYAPFLIVKCIKTKTPKKEIKNDANSTSTLPISVYSKKQYLINNAVIYFLFGILILLIIFAIFIGKWDIWLIVSLVILDFILSFITIMTISLINDPLRKILLCLNKNASYEEFERDLNKILKENLHPETINYLNIIKSNILATKNKQTSIELFNEVSIPTNKIFKLQYEMIEPIKYFNEGNLNKAKELIATFERKYPKNKKLESLKEQIKLQDASMTNDNVENIFNIHTAFKFSNIINANVLLEYYSKRGNMKKAKYYADYILSLNTDLDECNNDAYKLLDEMEKTTNETIK